MTRRTLWSLAAGLIVVLVAGCKGSSAPKVVPTKEESFIRLLLEHRDIDIVCAKLDKFVEGFSRGEARVRCDLVAEPLTQTGGVSDEYFYVPLGDVWVPLLNRDYDLVLKPASNLGGVTALLRAHGTTALLSVTPDPPRNSYFAPPDAQPSQPTKETLALFEAPPSTFDLIRAAFHSKVSDYRCDEAGRIEAIKLAVLMKLKQGVFPGAGLAVHSDVGIPGSMLWFVEMPKGRVSKLEWGRAEEVFSVTYATPNEKLYGDTLMWLPSLVRGTRPTGTMEPPEHIVLAARAVAGDREAAAKLVKHPVAKLAAESRQALAPLLATSPKSPGAPAASGK